MHGGCPVAMHEDSLTTIGTNLVSCSIVRGEYNSSRPIGLHKDSLCMDTYY